MRRIASHYVYWQRWYKLHYIELDAAGCLVGVFPLVQEIAGTEFYDGTLTIVPLGMDYPPSKDFSMEWLDVSCLAKVSSSVKVYRLMGVSPTAELGADHSRCNCHVERL